MPVVHKGTLDPSPTLGTCGPFCSSCLFLDQCLRSLKELVPLGHVCNLLLAKCPRRALVFFSKSAFLWSPHGSGWHSSASKAWAPSATGLASVNAEQSPLWASTSPQPTSLSLCSVDVCDHLLFWSPVFLSVNCLQLSTPSLCYTIAPNAPLPSERSSASHTRSFFSQPCSVWWIKRSSSQGICSLFELSQVPTFVHYFESYSLDSTPPPRLSSLCVLTSSGLQQETIELTPSACLPIPEHGLCKAELPLSFVHVPARRSSMRSHWGKPCAPEICGNWNPVCLLAWESCREESPLCTASAERSSLGYAASFSLSFCKGGVSHLESSYPGDKEKVTCFICDRVPPYPPAVCIYVVAEPRQHCYMVLSLWTYMIKV